MIVTTLTAFFLAALLEIGGGYLVWKWLREHKGKIFGLIGGLVLFVYGIIPTLQPAEFGRVYATYGGIFVVSSVLWGYWVDKKKPDRFEIIGSIIVLIGVTIIFYFPR
ncbi:YnfA family protein [Candidatus Nitrosotenuis aquarius]|uniref:YnfA family protein n=1 Tax=Candidatus Nitrosotenuis aquarius TaxID=1846278 RepID=UPI003B96892F